MRRVAFVVQRYGSDVLGGAEEHCRRVVERLAGRIEPEVFTTCARDYLTWRNAYPEGTERIAGVPVHRFPVARPRRVRAFGRFSRRVYDRPHSFRDEAEWMQRQGPDCPALLAAIAARREDFDLFFFFTYLYQTTYFGLPLVADKAVLLPTAHDEPPIRLGIYRAVFLMPRGIVYNTAEERSFVQALFHNAHVPSVIGGMGVDLPEAGAAAATPGGEPYLLYVGRVDVSKGCGELIESLRRLAAGGAAVPRLVLAGELKMKLPRGSGLEALGPVDERRKNELLAGALALVVPSRHESLSLVALEAWAAGLPVIAQGASAVLAGHLRRCGGGWAYRDDADLGRALAEAAADPAGRRQRGALGRAYVAEHYTWERTVAVYADFIEQSCARVREPR